MTMKEMEFSDTSEVEAGNPAMADAMRRVLSIGKNSGKSSVVLSKAKVLTKNSTKKPEDCGFEVEEVSNAPVDVVAEIKIEKTEDTKPNKLQLKRKRVKRQEVAALGRIKPTPLDREKERPLVKLATRGVVQLFNAVREQQKLISKKIEQAGPLMTKKEKVLKSIDKKAFLDVLKGCSDQKSSKNDTDPEIKTEDEDVDVAPSGWSVLRDDFMMGAKLKDWDKNDEELELVDSKKPKNYE